MKKNSVTTITDNNIGIIGNNILFDNSIVTAYYIIPLTNYGAISDQGKLSSVLALTNILNNVISQRPELKFSLQRISKTIKREDVYDNLLETIRMYAPEYDMPIEFSSRIKDSHIDYCLLGIDIKDTDISDVEGQTITEIFKDLLTQAAGKIFQTDTSNKNIEKLLAVEENIFSMLSSSCVRASKELVFYNYVSKLYPAYEISYTKQSFFNDDNFSRVLGSLVQTVEDGFGYFIMHNEGIDMFSADPQDVYGCVLNIRDFPGVILSHNFPMNLQGLQINVEVLKKEKAEIMLKRRRSSDRFEYQQAIEAGEENEGLNKVIESINITEKALGDLDEGLPICRFNASLLVLGNTREELSKNTNLVISSLKDRNIVAAKSLNQATDFINTYVKLIPSSYDHMAPLQFPLSFQMNSGSIVGEYDTHYGIPAIGEDY